MLCVPDFMSFGHFFPQFLRDETGSGRGVHRFWGSPIQKSRSNFSLFSDFSLISGIFGVGVVYFRNSPVVAVKWVWSV